MSLIIDSCVVSRVLFHDDYHYLPVKKALMARRNVMVYGGKLKREYIPVTNIRRILFKFDQAGIAKVFPDVDVDNQTDIIKKMKTCVSNDEHIIALARVSGARLLCSEDSSLHTDFKCKKLIDSPRGKIYQTRKHISILNENCDNEKYH